MSVSRICFVVYHYQHWYLPILYCFSSYSQLLVANYNLIHLHLAPMLGVIPFKFCRDLWRQKTRVPGLSSGISCMILCLAILIQYWRVCACVTGAGESGKSTIVKQMK